MWVEDGSLDDDNESIRDDGGNELGMGMLPDPTRDMSKAGGPDDVLPNIGWSWGWVAKSCDLPDKTELDSVPSLQKQKKQKQVNNFVNN